MKAHDRPPKVNAHEVVMKIHKDFFATYHTCSKHDIFLAYPEQIMIRKHAIFCCVETNLLKENLIIDL